MPFVPDKPKSGFVPDVFPTQEPPEVKKSFMQKVSNAVTGTADFLGVNKFGQGLSTIGSSIPGQTAGMAAQDTQNVAQLLARAKTETDPAKKQRLLDLAKTMGSSIEAKDINAGLGLSNKEVLGSAGNVALNIATAGLQAPKGATALGRIAKVAGQGAVLGGAGAISEGLNQDKSLSDSLKQAPTGALIGGALGGVAQSVAELGKLVTARQTTEKLMNKALATPKKVIEKGRSPANRFMDEGITGTRSKMLDTSKKVISEVDSEINGILTENKTVFNSADIKKSITDKLAEKFSGMLGEEDVAKIVDGLPIDTLNKKPTVTAAELNTLRKKIDNTFLGSSKWLNNSTSENVIGLKAATNVMRDMVKSTDDRLPALYDRMADHITAKTSLTSELSKPHILSNLIELAVSGLAGAATGQGDVKQSAKNAAAIFAAWNLLQSGVPYSKSAVVLNKAGQLANGKTGTITRAVGRAASQALVRRGSQRLPK